MGTRVNGVDLDASPSGPALSDATPAALGVASAGVSTEASRADHVHAPASRSPVPPACVARWLLDDTGATIDDSVGAYDLAYSGAAGQQSRPSPWGACIYAGGLAAGAGPKGAAALEPAAVSVAVWVKALTYASPSPFLVAKRQDDATWSGSSPTSWGLGIYTDTGGRVGAGVNAASGGAGVLASSDSWRITLGAWCRVVATYDTTNGLRLYLDGQFVGSAAAAGAILWGSGSWTIGVNNSGSGVAFAQTFDGFIRDVCVCDRVLTAAEILRDYQQGIGYAP